MAGFAFSTSSVLNIEIGLFVAPNSSSIAPSARDLLLNVLHAHCVKAMPTEAEIVILAMTARTVPARRYH
jgi:hypothetical protein